MGRFEVLLFTLTLFGTLAYGAKLGNGLCKNCKTKNAASNSQRLIASPINLLNPDRYEFFTLDDKGKVVKRIMTFKEIQSIVAGSDITELKLFANKNNNDRIVSSVVSNVRNVLNNELNLINGHDSIDTAEQQQLPISDVISSPYEPLGGSSTMYDVLHKLGENLVTLKTQNATSRPTAAPERTTKTTTTTTTTTTTSIPQEDLTSRWILKTTPKPITSTEQKVKETITQSTTATPTTTSTERTTTTTSRSTVRPGQQRTTTTVRPTERSTTERPSVRSTEKSTVTKTTSLPSTTVSTTPSTTTERPTTTTTTTTTNTTTTTVQPIKQSALRRSTTTTTTTTAMPTTEAQIIKWSAASLASVRSTEPPVQKSSSSSTTTTEAPAMFKEAQPSTVTIRSTLAPTTKTSTTASSTTEASITKTTSEQPPVTTSTTVMKPTEQSIEHSSHRSEEVSGGDNFVEYLTEQSAEKWDDSRSSETTTYTTSEETSSETVSAELLITKLNEMVQQSVLMESSSVKVPDSSTTDSTVNVNQQTSTSEMSTLKDKDTEEFESLKDLEPSDDEDDSDEEVIATTAGFSTWFTDPISSPQNMPIDTIVKETNEVSNDETDQPTITVESTLLDDTVPTTTSLELDSSTAQDSSSNTEEQESDEAQLTSLNLDSQETTTTVAEDDESYLFQTDSEQTVSQDTSTIPTDAQHAIHKIIESLQSINDDSASDETEEADSQEAGYTEDIPGMNYDSDAQSSINAIIQSLGGSESGIFSIATTTDMIATSEQEEPTTVTQVSVKSNIPTKANIVTERIPVSSSTPLSTSISTVSLLKTSKPDVVSSETESSGTFNYNTNIMDTIEKFLSSFGSLPKENSYSANLTELNILSDYPSEINMTDYVDRTATVASVLKFPQTASVEEAADRSAIDRGTSEAESSLEDAAVTIEPEMNLPDQPILSETVASFMKLGEMLTMGTRVSSTEENPTPVQQLEVKTAIDEEETELLRFLSICSTLGTNVYDYLLADDPSNERRSIMSRHSLVYSPFATLTTLSMLFLGTRGTTAESINAVIGLDEMTSFNPHLFFKSVAEDLKQKYRRTYGRETDEQGSSFSRTLLSDESRGGLQRFFKARIQEIYSTVAETVDFRQKDMLLRHMNGDFPRDYVDTLKQMRSPLVSISRNRYRHECNNAATTYGTMQFTPSVKRSPSPVTIPSVSIRSGFSTGFSKALDATILALPGSTSNVSVFFLKPSVGSDVLPLETHLRNQSISNVLKLFPDETVRSAYTEVQLPYFTQTTIYNMTQSIQHLGLQNLFEPNVANFNGLQDSATSNLYLSEVIQTDSFSLCGAGETGTARNLPLRSFSTNLIKYTTALPADWVNSNKQLRRDRRKLAYRNRSAFDAQNVQDSKLVFDTPFLYLVRHNPTGMVLYMGRFVG